MRVDGRYSVLAAGFLGALFVTAACPVYPGWGPTTSYRCDPAGRDPQCPTRDDYLCCSDDGLAIELANPDAFALPSFADSGGSGVPVFALDRNANGRWGMCVRRGSVPPVADVGNGCPIPCNPRWDEQAVESVCGVGQICCQTSEIDARDCVFDSSLGDAGCHRPVRGEDITGLGGLELSDWAAGRHATHQDPGGVACQAFVDDLDDAQLEGSSREAVLAACIRQLGVADQRGFCLGVSLCPLAQPSYRDACEQLNDEQGLSGCD